MEILNSNAKIYALIGIGLLIIIGMVIWLAVILQQKPKTPDTNIKNGIQIFIVNGKPILTKDFLSGKTSYGNITPLFSETGYAAQYDSEKRNITISFQVSSIAEYVELRAEAERLLMTELGVTNEVACQLPITERVQVLSETQDETLIYKLSFCN
jgi:hypothetical protein